MSDESVPQNAMQAEWKSLKLLDFFIIEKQETLMSSHLN
jgi:hypothetical protein